MASSSIAAGDITRRAMEAAQPLVMADAATHAAAETETFRADTQSERDVRLHGQDVDLTNVQGDIASNLQSEKAGQITEQTKLEGDIRSRTQGEAAEQDLVMQEYLQGGVNQRFADELALNTEKLSADNRRAFSSATGPMFQQALAEKTKINQLADSVMSSENKLAELARIDDALERDVNFISSIYNYPLTWRRAAA